MFRSEAVYVSVRTSGVYIRELERFQRLVFVCACPDRFAVCRESIGKRGPPGGEGTALWACPRFVCPWNESCVNDIFVCIHDVVCIIIENHVAFSFSAALGWRKGEGGNKRATGGIALSSLIGGGQKCYTYLVPRTSSRPVGAGAVFWGA